MHAGETLPTGALLWLLEGYQEVAPLPDGYRKRTTFASLLIAIRALGRVWQKRPETRPTHHGLCAISRELQLWRA
jgi:hypothetical protein